MDKLNRELKFFVITDLHYYSKEIGQSGKAYEKMANFNHKIHKESAEVFSVAWDILISDKETEIVLIHGDLTNNGEKASHYEFRELLKKLVDLGKRVYLTYSTHDYKKTGKAKGYIEDETIDIPAFTLDEVRHFYDDFGVKQAIAYHKETGSYVAELDTGFRLLALNDDFGYTRSGYTKETAEWIKAQAEKAKSENTYIFAMAHHPIIPASPLYKIVGKNDIIENSDYWIDFFASLGVNLYFTGHSHMHKISYRITEKGGIFFNVSTSSMIGYPPCIRKVTLTQEKANIETKLIEQVKGVQGEFTSFPLFLRHQFLGMIEDFVAGCNNNDWDRVKDIAGGISQKPKQIDKKKWLLKPLTKIIGNLTYGKMIKWTRAETKIDIKHYEDVKEKKVLPVVVELIANLYNGAPKYTPDTLEYKLIMGASAIADSIIKVIPFNLKKKTGFNSISEIVEPMAYNQVLDNYNVTLNFENGKGNLSNEEKYQPPYNSKKGIFIALIILFIGVIISPLILGLSLFALAKKMFKKICRKVKRL